MSDRPEIEAPGNVDLPVWIQEALKQPLRPAPAAAPATHRSRPEWPLLLDAALVTGFLPRDLAPGTVDESQRPQAERNVLQFAETTYAADGIRWSVTREARRAVLAEALQTGEIQAALARTAARSADPITRALRDCLTGGGIVDESADLPVLEAHRAAVSLLTGIPSLHLPPIEAFDRRIEFRRLVAQFERMIGKSGRSDRFFGRANEREQLNGHVDVVGAATYVGTAQRVLNRAVHTVTARPPLTVWGVGGVGKTTLICKFMLEHIEAATSSAQRFPFAYLDFDRATVSARNRAGVLLEMCAQVGAQFDELAVPMAGLRERARETGRRMAARPEGDSIEPLAEHLAEFRTLIDDHLRGEESLFHRQRPFLLVFDTFEVVQYTQDDVLRMEEFVKTLHGDKSWSRLRLIICGRQQPSQFLGATKDLALGALDPHGSAEMLMALAADASKPIARAEAERLVAAVARASGEPTGGVHPLRLRLIGNLFQQIKESGPAIVGQLVDELLQPSTDSRSITAQVLVDGVLVRRVLGHVADARVRALADPGLVVRRITPDVIREVMARGTPDPAAPLPAPGERDTRPMWAITDDQARDIFSAFRREVSLVEGDGEHALRHLAHVRLQMLPLIRLRSRAQFDRLHQLAYEFFARSVERDDTDWASLAEAIYHGLWIGVPIADIERMWRPEASFEPRINEDDFPDDSVQHLYLRAKGQRHLTPGELRRLAPAVALGWLDRRSTDLLGERRVDDAVEAVRAISGAGYAALRDRPATAAVVARLLMRAGLWQEAVSVADEQLVTPPHDAHGLSILRTRTTIESKTPGRRGSEQLLDIARATADPLIRVELLSHLTIAAARQSGTAGSSSLRQEALAAGREIPIDRWLRDIRILRLFLIAAPQTDSLHLAAYIAQCERIPRDRTVAPLIPHLLGSAVGGKDVSEAVDALRIGKGRRRDSFNTIDKVWRGARQPDFRTRLLTGTAAEAGRLIVAHDHADWHWTLGNALSRELKHSDGQLARSLVTAGFVEERSHREPTDGVTIVQNVVDEGQLLECARQLTEWGAAGMRTESARSDYPQDVFGIAAALVRWHETILVLIQPSDSPEKIA